MNLWRLLEIDNPLNKLRTSCLIHTSTQNMESNDCFSKVFFLGHPIEKVSRLSQVVILSWSGNVWVLCWCTRCVEDVHWCTCVFPSTDCFLLIVHKADSTLWNVKEENGVISIKLLKTLSFVPLSQGEIDNVLLHGTINYKFNFLIVLLLFFSFLSSLL